jgi:hypothetical protein
MAVARSFQWVSRPTSAMMRPSPRSHAVRNPFDDLVFPVHNESSRPAPRTTPDRLGGTAHNDSPGCPDAIVERRCIHVRDKCTLAMLSCLPNVARRAHRRCSVLSNRILAMNKWTVKRHSRRYVEERQMPSHNGGPSILNEEQTCPAGR